MAFQNGESLRMVLTKANQQTAEELQLALIHLQRLGLCRNMTDLLTMAARHYLETELKEITESEEFQRALKAGQIKLETEALPSKKKKKNSKTTCMRLSLGTEDMWILDRIGEVVEIKERMGLVTSKNKEILELVRSGLISSDYGKTLRSLLRVSKGEL